MRYLVIAIFFFNLFNLSTAVANESHDIYLPQNPNALNNIFRHTIDSTSLKTQRVINVSLPYNYQETGTKVKYPLIVVLDGELLFHSVSICSTSGDE